jgi:hypothetical protein
VLLADLALDASLLLRVESRARLERSRVEFSPLKLQSILLNLGQLAALLELVPEDEISSATRGSRRSFRPPPLAPILVKRWAFKKLG